MPARSPRFSRGFTLIELLVSMTILAMLVVLFAQALGNISSAWARGQEKMDNFAKARAMLNRLQIDLQNVVIRDDLPTFPLKDAESQLAFYTLQRGISTGNTRALSYVNYASGLGAKIDQLLRADQAYTYTDSPAFGVAPTPSYLPTPSPTPVPAPASTPSTNLALSQGQLGFDYGFLHPDGKYSARYDRNSSNVESKAVAVTVGILVMDNKSSAILRDRNLLDALVADFKIANPPQDEDWSPKSIWEYQLGLISTSPPGGGSRISLSKYGAASLDGIRAFERTYALPHSNL